MNREAEGAQFGMRIKHISLSKGSTQPQSIVVFRARRMRKPRFVLPPAINAVIVPAPPLAAHFGTYPLMTAYTANGRGYQAFIVLSAGFDVGGAGTGDSHRHLSLAAMLRSLPLVRKLLAEESLSADDISVWFPRRVNPAYPLSIPVAHPCHMPWKCPSTTPPPPRPVNST